MHAVVCFRILRALDDNERRLFRERIRQLDKKIQPGFAKLSWSKKGAGDVFINECRVQARKVWLLTLAHEHPHRHTVEFRGIDTGCMSAMSRRY